MVSNTHNSKLISPYGGQLVNLVVTGEERQEIIERSKRLPSIKISARALCDLELLATGAFSPLDRFMKKADYERVLTEMRLENGALFPIPVTLPLDEDALPSWGEQVTLCDARNNTLAVMQIEEVYHWDPLREARLVLGTTDSKHPLISEMVGWGKVYVSGALKVVDLPYYYDFVDLRRTPLQVRDALPCMAWYETDAAADEKLWEFYASGGHLGFRTVTGPLGVEGAFLVHSLVGVSAEEVPLSLDQGG